MEKPKEPEVKYFRQIPPYNGFGSEEDSLGFCLKTLPDRPKGDFVKFMTYDRHGYDSNVLRFAAKLQTEVSSSGDKN